MSQGDLSEKMNVSRQSISKWETDTSIPDLDKLIMLSNLFQISIDELVKESNQSDISAADKTDVQANAVFESTIGVQKIIGFILLAIGLAVGMLALIFIRRLPIIPILYICLCGVLCLVVKKYVALIIGWITILPIIPLLPIFTSTRLLAVFNPIYYHNGLYLQIVVSLVIWIVLLVLTVFTGKAIYKSSFMAKNN